MARFEPAQVRVTEWIALGSGLVAFIASFLPWYEVSFAGPTNILGLSYSINAWQLGFGGWFPMLLVAAAAGLILARQLGTQMPAVRGGWVLIYLTASVVALIILLIRWLTLPSADVQIASVGAGFGLYLGLLAVVAFGVAAFMSFRSEGHRIADVPEMFRRPGTGPTAP